MLAFKASISVFSHVSTHYLYILTALKKYQGSKKNNTNGKQSAYKATSYGDMLHLSSDCVEQPQGLIILRLHVAEENTSLKPNNSQKSLAPQGAVMMVNRTVEF